MSFEFLIFLIFKTKNQNKRSLIPLLPPNQRDFIVILKNLFTKKISGNIEELQIHLKMKEILKIFFYPTLCLFSFQTFKKILQVGHKRQFVFFELSSSSSDFFRYVWTSLNVFWGFICLFMQWIQFIMQFVT